MSLTARAFRIEPYVEFAKKAIARESTYRFEVFTAIGSFVVRDGNFRADNDLDTF